MNIKLSIYFAARAAGLFALCRLLTRSRIRILGYHGASLGDESNYNPFLFLSAETFERRIGWLRKKKFNVISLKHAVEALDGTIDAGRLPTVITFDDGWHSTATDLIPILAKKGLPSTLYLHTSHFEEDWPVLAVTVNYMMWKSNRPSIEVKGLGAAIDGKYQLAEPAVREVFHQKVHHWLVSPSATRESVIDRLHRLAKSMGLEVDGLALETRRFDYMSRDGLLQLPELGCAVELHGHQHRYPVGDPETFAADLTACREAILKLGLPEPRHYCYPSGNFDSAAGVTLDALGVRSATTCVPGPHPGKKWSGAAPFSSTISRQRKHRHADVRSGVERVCRSSPPRCWTLSSTHPCWIRRQDADALEPIRSASSVPRSRCTSWACISPVHRACGGSPILQSRC